ncbi:MAG: DUF2891 domain-containing protein [Candidatus Eiseniibacteriota bacterium]
MTVQAPPAQILASANLALAAIQREYPFHLVHVAASDADVRPPRELHPAFGAAFDWHSAVHGHWCVIRALRLTNDAAFAAAAVPVLDRHLASGPLGGELRYLEGAGREGFERPYGLAWLLQLAAELREWRDQRAARWLAALEPLERLAAARLSAWLPRLPWPVRSGEHAQTAFSMGLALDHARGAGATSAAASIMREALRLFAQTRAADLAREPSAHDFLSPALGEADLMRRVLPAPEFARWFAVVLPDGAAERLEPVRSPDPSDGKLSHLIGLNLSRAWMLEGIASAMEAEPAAAGLIAASARHRAAGLAGVSAEHYAGSHWLGSFAVYLLTRRGIPAA